MFHLYPPENIKKPNVPFLYPPENVKKPMFSEVFRGYRKVTLGQTGLTTYFPQKPVFEVIPKY